MICQSLRGGTRPCRFISAAVNLPLSVRRNTEDQLDGSLRNRYHICIYEYKRVIFMERVATETIPLPVPGTGADGADLLARLFAGVSDPTRLRILLALLEHERNVSELVSLVGSSQGRVSIHLQCLRWCGFVESERRGKFVYYRVRDPRVRQLVKLAQEMVVMHGEQLASCAVLKHERDPGDSV
jgi:DNA-binding transcriptional ArsR family regulator